MKTFKHLPVSEEEKLQIMNMKGVHGCLQVNEDHFILYGPKCQYKTRSEIAVIHSVILDEWVKQENRTDKAIDLLASGGADSPADAAKKAGVHHAAVYREIKRRKSRGLCPHCHRLMP